MFELAVEVLIIQFSVQRSITSDATSRASKSFPTQKTTYQQSACEGQHLLEFSSFPFVVTKVIIFEKHLKLPLCCDNMQQYEVNCSAFLADISSNPIEIQLKPQNMTNLFTTNLTITTKETSSHNPTPSPPAYLRIHYSQRIYRITYYLGLYENMKNLILSMIINITLDFNMNYSIHTTSQLSL